jgi:hypothetical protein
VFCQPVRGRRGVSLGSSSRSLLMEYVRREGFWIDSRFAFWISMVGIVGLISGVAIVRLMTLGFTLLDFGFFFRDDCC